MPWWAPDDPQPDPLTLAQPLVALAISVAAVLTVRPLGWTGWPLVGGVLLAATIALTFVRSAPDRVLPPRSRLPSAAVGAVLAALLFGYDPGSMSQGFVCFMAVHSGVRFEPAVAAALAAVEGVIAGGILLIRGEPDGVPWWLAIALAGTVVFGMLRRTRLRTLQATRDLVEQTRRAAAADLRAQQLSDRAELARDLHDVLAHSLSGVNMQLSMADALLDAGRTDEGRTAVQRARGMVVDGLTEARRAVQALRADTLELVPTLRAMIAADTADEQLTVTGAGTRVSPQQVPQVVRIAQEALTNARRHAPGAAVRMVLDRQPNRLRLTVINGPARRDLDAGSGSGFGLVGMRERAGSIGARVTAEPVLTGEYAGGWLVVLDVPALPAPDHPKAAAERPAEPPPADHPNPSHPDSGTSPQRRETR